MMLKRSADEMTITTVVTELKTATVQSSKNEGSATRKNGK